MDINEFVPSFLLQDDDEAVGIQEAKKKLLSPDPATNFPVGLNGYGQDIPPNPITAFGGKRIDDDDHVENSASAPYQSSDVSGENPWHAFEPGHADEQPAMDDSLLSFSPSALLEALFPNLSPAQVVEILEECDYDIPTVVERLTSDDGSADKTQRPTGGYNGYEFEAGDVRASSHSPANFSPSKPTGKPVCRHFMQGSCYRADCWFSHDLDTTLCKFWLRGFCSRGTNCAFSHGEGLVTGAVAASVESPVGSTSPRKAAGEIQQPKQSTEDFPVLGRANDKKAKPREAHIDFLAPPGRYTEAVKRSNNKQETGQFKEGIATVAPAGTAKKLQKVRMSVGWVATGSTIDTLYSKVRKDAEAAAVERNKLFQRATEAYLSGNKAAAKAFSLQAHQVNKVMEELHQEASQRIFDMRNKDLGGSGDERVIDLHGLHGNEAIHYVSTALQTLQKERFRGLVSVITGTGHHSRSSVAKVQPEIRRDIPSKKVLWKMAVAVAS
ncbi:hypothetical protein HDU96_006940 [Phlyctochytrium bullatum]|nr:hypothetical protein HDU96_006940 [Phlyctochytrium bullatum]